MKVDLRQPNITANTSEGKIAQMQSYLVQLVGQLQYALYVVEKEEASVYQMGKQEIVKTASPEEEAQSTFNSIKSLIIKSADIVEAYSEEISRKFSGLYVAQSEFGTFEESTNQKITENSEGIEQVFKDIQEIISSVEEIKNTKTQTDAYIKSGLLEYDSEGLPIYGLEIGQKNMVDGEETFNKYARFSSEKLSFYDRNDIEVAYISDYKLYITNAEIKGNLTLGKYEIDTSDGLIFRWAGD